MNILEVKDAELIEIIIWKYEYDSIRGIDIDKQFITYDVISLLLIKSKEYFVFS